MDIGLFRDHLDALKEVGYTTGTLNDLFSWQEDSRLVPEKPLLITFDDGWASNYKLAHPQFSHLQMKWSVFVVVELRSQVFTEGEDTDKRLSDEQLIELSEAGAGFTSKHLMNEGDDLALAIGGRGMTPIFIRGRLVSRRPLLTGESPHYSYGIVFCERRDQYAHYLDRLIRNS